MVPLSYTSLKSNDMYLMDEGSSLIMFIGKLNFYKFYFTE